MKQIIRLTEGDIHRLVAEVVNNVLNQGSDSLSSEAIVNMVYYFLGVNLRKDSLNEAKNSNKFTKPLTKFSRNKETGELEEVLDTPIPVYDRKTGKRRTLRTLKDYIEWWNSQNEAFSKMNPVSDETVSEPNVSSEENEEESIEVPTYTDEKGVLRLVMPFKDDKMGLIDTLDKYRKWKEGNKKTSLNPAYRAILVDYYTGVVWGGEACKKYGWSMEETRRMLEEAFAKLSNDKDFKKTVIRATWLKIRDLVNEGNYICPTDMYATDKNGEVVLVRGKGEQLTPADFKRWFGTLRRSIDGFEVMMRRGGEDIEKVRDTTETGKPVDQVSSNNQTFSPEFKKQFESLVLEYVGDPIIADGIMEYFSHKIITKIYRDFKDKYGDELKHSYQMFRLYILGGIKKLGESSEFKNKMKELVFGNAGNGKKKLDFRMSSAKKAEMHEDYKKLIYDTYEKLYGARIDNMVKIPDKIGYDKASFIDFFTNQMIPGFRFKPERERNKIINKIIIEYLMSSFLRKWKANIVQHEADNKINGE